jgi:hypothetical protein
MCNEVNCHVLLYLLSTITLFHLYKQEMGI